MDQPTVVKEEVHNVVWPLGKSAYAAQALNNRLGDLNGKVIGELWDRMFQGEEIYPAIRAALKERFPDVRFIDYTRFENIHGPHQREAINKLPALFQQYGCDAVITGIGA